MHEASSSGNIRSRLCNLPPHHHDFCSVPGMQQELHRAAQVHCGLRVRMHQTGKLQTQTSVGASCKWLLLPLCHRTPWRLLARLLVSEDANHRHEGDSLLRCSFGQSPPAVPRYE